MAGPSEVYDLIILVDATASMGSYLTSLQTSLPQIISISALTGSFSRIGLLAYRDYCDSNLIEWSGWMPQDAVWDDKPSVDLLAAAKTLSATGGGDYPEATKTGLAKAYEVMREDATTVILLYTDAPPHTVAGSGSVNHRSEQRALEQPDSYGGFGPLFADWVRGARTMALKEGKKRAQVFSLLEPSMSRDDGTYYTFLSTVTGGACFYLDKAQPKDISKVTVDLLLAWMGVEKEGAAVTPVAAWGVRFKNASALENVTKESAKEAEPGSRPSKGSEELPLNSACLKEFLPKREIPVQDFALRYNSDNSYKALVASQLQKIIDQDVSAISLNPVFGSLWRAVCNDRSNDNREGLISSFGLQVDRIKDAALKEMMTGWLAESYDYSADVAEAIGLVPEYEQFPCVYLDPTHAFTHTHDNDDGQEEEDNRPITEFTRGELLEISRSCDYRILRRLGRVLTRLTFVNTREELPAHIANAEDTVTRIPMALASKEFGHKFWRILLHIVVPGTMLSARPAALLAALTIRLGIQPLSKAAGAEMLMWRDKWNNIEVPETWNVSCLSLLLDADRAYSDRHQGEKSEIAKTNRKGLLRETDKKLFDRLVSYKMLELNLQTSLVAKVGWRPEKTPIPIGPVVVCKSCQYPRSVTIMGPKGKCGNCIATDFPTPEERQAWIEHRVTKDDNEATEAIWVECRVRTCRAQYVVYHPEALNVTPKCHYCRQQSTTAGAKTKHDSTPYLECDQCLNRVIFPKEYRSHSSSRFKCVACSNDRSSVIDVETNANELSKENGTNWLLENKKDKMNEPLGGRSLFRQLTEAGIEDFCERVILFPSPDKQNVVLDGKTIQNYPDLVKQLESWVSRRRTESGTCSLCFSDLRKADLNSACGRRGCDQKVCRACLCAWYGLNGAGRIINIAALSCPFCRRAPTAKTLHGYGMGIHAVGDLGQAVRNAGQWVYAWCMDCARAKQYLERVCAAGAPTELSNFVCDPCGQIREEASRRETEALQAEMARMEVEGRRLNYERRVEVEAAMERSRLESLMIKKVGQFKCCPGCTVLTEKSYGCGHMDCPCGTTWCWFCGEKSTQTDIYRHMDKQHNGWFAGDDEDDEGDDE
ncbi:uncharacterized protein BP5553_06476 [Venustampulla echinocandica]|uniref:RING-type domain-containing protein n=1 Tax=Venustampulla echinocandica TaxID=2656787 RepID=A0A370TK19_9HELO|nr:uncharacterized protein BP5553_06476 [Venustampulla echinocandica]RDL35864.1 hypothetical protein BP5553_06476 [Venustampulla echinocandica]